MILNQKFKKIKPPSSVADKLRFGVWFDRYNRLSYESVPPLERYVTDHWWISVKQAPCALTLKAAGSNSVNKNRHILEENGVPVIDREEIQVPKTWVGLEEVQETSGDTGLEEILAEALESPGSDTTLLNLLGRKEPTPIPDIDKGDWVSIPSKKRFAIDYADPWRIFAGRALAGVRGNPEPQLRVWYGDLVRLSDPIPPILLGEEFEKGMQKKKRLNPIPFAKIKNTDCVLHLIKYHTHWGSALWKLAKFGDHEESKWAETMKGRLKAFLRGKPDPLWFGDQVERYYIDPKEIRDPCSRSARLLELLKTADGMFVQRYLAYPEEIWSWEKYDLYLLRNINYLISDEFFDGNCTPEVLNIVTFYSSLKKARKLFKDFALKGKTLESSGAVSQLPDWLRHLCPLWDKVCSWNFSEYKIFVIGILSQSRGCGTPPMIDVLRSKKKFIETVTTPNEPLSETASGMIRAGLNRILNDLPDSAFTGLSTKAKVTLTSSACWETTVKEGGTVQAISDELLRIPPYTKIPIRDLETGKISGRVQKDSLNIGELVFWHCLQKVVQTPIQELRKVFLLIVKEPGKARSVTKSLSYLKIVLDVVSKICSWPLKKGISSSESGMSKESHGWEFFKRMFSQEEPNLFKVRNTEKRKIDDKSYLIAETYEDVFVSSTDYETATDYMDHQVARLVSEAWMRKCGIPAFLRGIVHGTCYQPREIYFKAERALSSLGNSTEDESIRVVTSTRGVLMGDPLTKPCLHLINVLARVMAENCYKADFLSVSFTNSAELAQSFRNDYA